MSIIRVTVRTFESVEHANIFVVMSEKVANESNNTNLEINVKVFKILTKKIKLIVYGIMMTKNT